MIIRIMGEGQYRAPDAILEDLNAIDNRIVELVEKGDREGFRNELLRMVSLVRERCEPLDVAEITESDLILPPPDLTFEEARGIFRGQGLIED
ncbi:MAG TPA: hypothetical protein PK659_04715 [Methanothrix sp.]|nr:hypothetical protein [Methanothrix sp.]HOK58215.1 hypothetical protein [Methanothrix sp.]HOL43539.1 hypothetical protein [Methanothrix sp.]HPO88586.1 hypothetical protein [Methanothrix sp.]